MSSECDKDLKSVIEYWTHNPVHSVEFKDGMDIRAYCGQIDELRWSDNERWAKKTFYEIDLKEGARILDAGCGIGVFTRYYSKKGFDVHAIDITDTAVEITRKSLEALGLYASVVQGNIEAIPYPDNFFDFVVSNGVVHHTPDTEQAVREIFRILKPKGMASICVYYKNVLLRAPLFTIIKGLLPLLLKGKKLEGRENFFTARTPEDFVRAYDGNKTPIAKVYSRKQADKLFSAFEIIRAEPHYFPIRFIKYFRVGGLMHKVLDYYCGTLIYYLLRKPG